MKSICIRIKLLLAVVIVWIATFAGTGGKLENSSKQAHARKLTYKGNTYDIFTADPTKDHIQLYWKGSKGQILKSIGSLKAEVQQSGRTLLFATNAGMYLTDNSPQGLYVENRKELRPLDISKKKSGNFYMQPNGVFIVEGNKVRVTTSAAYSLKKGNPDYATQSGPLLVIEGTINEHFTEGSTNLNIRSGVGVNKEGKAVFVISEGLVNFYDFAMVFRDSLQCSNALYLDGAISKMYLPELNLMDQGGDFGAMIAVTASQK